MSRYIVIALIALLAAPAFAAGTPANEDEKTLYAVGMIVARQLSVFNLTPAELETVKQGLSGAFFSRPTAESLAAAVQSFDDNVYDPYAIRRYAEGFDRAVFTVQLTDYVNQLTGRVAPVPGMAAWPSS